MGEQAIRFELERKGEKAATAELERISVADGVRRIELKGALHGVLVLGGSEGGAPLRTAAWLASHGYAALALAYFRYEDLPAKLEAIPLEYFGRAVAWLMHRPEIASEHIGVMGTSRGGELALQVASIYSQLKAVVAYVPASVRYPGCCGDTRAPYAWTLAGRPLPFANPSFRSDLDERRDHLGGTPQGDAESSLDVTPKVLVFLRQSLR